MIILFMMSEVFFATRKRSGKLFHGLTCNCIAFMENRKLGKVFCWKYQSWKVIIVVRISWFKIGKLPLKLETSDRGWKFFAKNLSFQLHFPTTCTPFKCTAIWQMNKFIRRPFIYSPFWSTQAYFRENKAFKGFYHLHVHRKRFVPHLEEVIFSTNGNRIQLHGAPLNNSLSWVSFTFVYLKYQSYHGFNFNFLNKLQAVTYSMQFEGTWPARCQLIV